MANPTTTNQYNSQTQPGLLGAGGISNASTTTPGYQGAFGAAGVPFAPGTPQAIPLGIGVANTPKMDLPPKPTSTAAANLTSAANGVIGGGTQSTGNGTQTNGGIKTPTTSGSGTIGKINDLFGQAELIPGQVESEYDLKNRLNLSNEAQKKSQANDLKYATMEDKIRKQAGMTSGQADAKIAAIERDRAYETAALAMDYAAKSNNYTSMAALADKQSALRLDNLKMRLNFYENLQGQEFQSARDRVQHEYNLAEKAESLRTDLIKSAMADGKYQEGMSTMDTEGLLKLVGYTPTTNQPVGSRDLATQISNVISASKKEVPNANKAVGVLTGIQNLANSNVEGNFVGAAGGNMFSPVNLRTGEKRKEFISNRANFGAIEGAVQSWMTGANVGEDQRKFVNGMVPQKSDTDFAIRTKLNELTNYMQGQVQSELASKGVRYNPVKFDWFAPDATSQLDALAGIGTGVPAQTGIDLENLWNQTASQ